MSIKHVPYISLTSVGERLTLALVILAFCAEMLASHWPAQTVSADPIDFHACVAMCHAQGTHVNRIESYACQCAPPKDEP